jgi:hypothetical protein
MSCGGFEGIAISIELSGYIDADILSSLLAPARRFHNPFSEHQGMNCK